MLIFHAHPICDLLYDDETGAFSKTCVHSLSASEEPKERQGRWDRERRGWGGSVDHHGNQVCTWTSCTNRTTERCVFTSPYLSVLDIWNKTADDDDDDGFSLVVWAPNSTTWIYLHPKSSHCFLSYFFFHPSGLFRVPSYWVSISFLQLRPLSVSGDSVHPALCENMGTLVHNLALWFLMKHLKSSPRCQVYEQVLYQSWFYHLLLRETLSS